MTKDPLSQDKLARYEVPGAPADFASRVIDRIAAGDGQPIEAVPPRRRWRWVAFASAGVAAAAMVTFFFGAARNAEKRAIDGAESDRKAAELILQQGLAPDRNVEALNINAQTDLQRAAINRRLAVLGQTDHEPDTGH